MRNYLIGLALVGIGGTIALGVRKGVVEQPERPAASAPATVPGVRPGEPEASPAAVPGTAAPVAVAQAAGGAAGAPVASGASGTVPVGSDGAPAPAAATRPAPDAARPTEPAAGASEPEAAEQGDAATILRQAAAAYARVRSLQADFTLERQNPLLRSRTSGGGTLYQRRPDRFLMRFTDPAGDLIVSDGRYFWLYYPSVDAKQVIRAPASAAGAEGVDLQAQFLGDPATRFQATLEGTETVQGRSAHVLTLVPREAAGYRRLKVWVDARDHMVRRFELTEENGVVQRYELRNLRVNPTLGDDLFRFTPPAGAHVIDRG